MIFALADDNMLSVHDSVDELQGACEGIDVENGIFQFFDKKGALEITIHPGTVQYKLAAFIIIWSI